MYLLIYVVFFLLSSFRLRVSSLSMNFLSRILPSTVANPSKLNDIDSILKKANGKFTKLLAGLKNKYGDKYVQCNIGTYEYDY